MSKNNARRRDVTLPYEKTYPWEDERGSTIDRTVDVNTEAKRVYAMQEQLLPTLGLDRPLDPVASKHLQDVGRRALILRGTMQRARKQQQNPQQSPKRVIPSRFPEIALNLDEGDAGEAEEEEDPVLTDGRIANILMDQEWDTRAWNTIKIQTAIETLYEEIEHSDDDSRRELAIKMLLRLMETHEDAVDYVETSFPSLTNKAFRTLSKLSNNTKIFRMARLVAVLAEWFAHILSNENAANKSIGCLVRETELCARIVQHHWRGVLFERTVNQRDYDPIVRTRLRAMHMIKFVELRHQLKVFREAVGSEGVPTSVTQAYITILYHLVKLQPDSISNRCRNSVLSDQRRILGSGLLVCLASLVTRRQSRHVIELVKGIVSNIIEGHGDDQLVAILQCNVVQRVQLDMQHTIQTSDSNTVAASITSLTSSLNLLHSIATKVLLVLSFVIDDSQTVTLEEPIVLRRRLRTSVCHFVLTTDVFDTLFETLSFCREKSDFLRAQVLEILCLLARSLGFSQVLEALTRDGGRWLEHLLLCLKDTNLVVVQAAITLFYELTSRTDARVGLTTAGAVQIFLRWCRPSLEACESRMAFVMGLTGCALLARQTEQVKPSSALLTAALTTFEQRLDALYSLLLHLAMQDETCPRASEKSAVYFLSVNALSTLVQFLRQVSPTCMESTVQNSRQRNISCILLGRFCKVPHVTQACFSENVINHLALSIQCSRLDELEGLVACSSCEDRLVHELGSKEACKALSRLARCPSNMVDARLRPSITSSHVPEWPQAMICDVMFRLHVLEDFIALLGNPNEAVEFAPVKLEKVLAAVQLAGYLRPLPYGASARDKFIKSHATHLHGKYAQAKLLQLVELVAPAILHLLREKNTSVDLVSACCTALSRLACTNTACSLLLTQGCLQTALLHLPDILIATGARKSSLKQLSIEFDSSVDEHGLLNVPASLYTLLGKLCAVADGRRGIMRAQVLPRLLKRMQLRHLNSSILDDECQSEIIVVISRLAMVNAVEGSTDELFLHFRVLELLTKVLQQHRNLVFTQSFVSSSTKKHYQVIKWRLLVHAVNAIAALSQDVFVCVPRVVALGIVELVYPFLVRLPVDGSLNPHLESLQFDAMTIIRSVASYPFGQFHAYLTNVKGTLPDHSSSNDAKKSSNDARKTLVMDRVKQIGFDFAMELVNKPMTLRDKKSVGELARETMAFINEHQQRLDDRQQEEHHQSTRIDCKREHQSRSTTTTSSKISPQIHASFPVLSTSPLSHLDNSNKTRSSYKTRKATRVVDAVESTLKVTSSVLVLDGSNSPVSLNGVNMASTRPAGNNKLRSSSESQHYVFTRPKSKTKKRDKDSAYCLMLDPLFGTYCTSSILSNATSKDLRYPPSEDKTLDCSYSFSQEVERYGHYTNVRARRSKKGDRYFPSLGRLVTSDTTCTPGSLPSQ